ncbi:MAG: LuxR C-terminal-related transcriptional regulator, partial [Chloroflexota bacterium]
MSTLILATKLYTPPPRPKAVSRPRLIERMNESLRGKLTLISAPAGFGKTTLVSEWAAACERPTAWLSLDEGDNDPARFLTYLVAALQTIAANMGSGVLAALQSPQPPPPEVILTALLNEVTTLTNNFVLVLDDYHVIDAQAVDKALSFLLEHLPPQMHLVIATRQDPQLPLARERARGQLTELRVADLRFSDAEAAEFLNQAMGLNLSAQDTDALETRTEGWIAGLQLAAISLQGHQAPSRFIQSFTGSHHFVLDYLVEEVLQQQPESVQNFLLRTSILDRLCSGLCDAVVLDPSVSGQEALAYLEHANLFIVPLDNERRWYRYHHLFADLLRQRLQQSEQGKGVDKLHVRASQWYEDNGLEIEAFQHAAAAHDIERAARLIEGDGIPRHFRGAVVAVLNWLGSLPTAVLDARPSLWWKYASFMLINGQTTGVEEKLQAAEAALPETYSDAKTRNLVGQIATARATLALTRYQIDNMIAQAQRALDYLSPDNLSFRATALWALGYARFLQGDRAASGRVYAEGLAISQAAGDTFSIILTAIGLGQIQEIENQLDLAAETYRYVLQVAGDQPIQIIYEAHLGLARIHYEWNDLAAAEQHGQQSLQLARQYDTVIDRFIVCEVFLARLKLAQGDLDGAAAMLAKAAQLARQKNFVYRIPEIAAAQVLTLLQQGAVAAAARLAQAHKIPVSQARVVLAQGDPSAALALLEPLRQQAEAKGWADERLRLMLLEALALYANSAKAKAVQLLADALILAEPSGLIRSFVDEGLPMAQLLSEVAAQGTIPGYVAKLLAVFEAQQQPSEASASVSSAQALIEPLSQRELEVLQLIAQGLSNHEIGERLFLALNTIKGHNQKIFGKLQVQRRTEAIARARELGLL